MRGAADGHRFVLTGRWIPEKGESGQLYASFKYWMSSDLGVGFDYRPLVDDVSMTLTYRAISEDPTSWKPAVILGTSEDDFSYRGDAVNSRSYFVTASKAFPSFEWQGITPAPYAGAVWIEEIDKLRPLVGLHLRHDEAAFMLQYSGTDTHMTLSRSINENVSVSAIYWGMKYPGLGIRLRF